MRESASHEGCYSLDVKHKGSVKHFLIQNNDLVVGVEKSFESLASLVTYFNSDILSAEGEMLRTPCPPPRIRETTLDTIVEDHTLLLVKISNWLIYQ